MVRSVGRMHGRTDPKHDKPKGHDSHLLGGNTLLELDGHSREHF